MKLNLQKIKLDNDYDEYVDNTILNMVEGTDMYNYIKYVPNHSLAELADTKSNKKVWLAAERQTERYKKHLSEYNREFWSLDEIEWEYTQYYYDRRVMEMDKIKDLQLSVQYHGIAAYTRNGPVENLERIVNDNNIVICGSDRAIGRIGVIFRGTAHRAFFCDVYSDRDERNSSDKNVSVSEELIYSMSETLIGKKQYIETFSTCKEVLAIWCRYFLDDEEECQIKEIANNIGVPIIIGKEMLRAGKFGSGNNLLDHYLK